jgi:hypothetical protein
MAKRKDSLLDIACEMASILSEIYGSDRVTLNALDEESEADVEVLLHRIHDVLERSKAQYQVTWRART